MRSVAKQSVERQVIWNRCDVCGRFIAIDDFHNEKAFREMTTPDSDMSVETYETLCSKHK